MPDELDISNEHDARIDALLRSLSEQDMALEPPPPSVWAGIERQLREEPTGEPTEEQPTASVVSLAERSRVTLVPYIDMTLTELFEDYALESKIGRRACTAQYEILYPVSLIGANMT